MRPTTTIARLALCLGTVTSVAASGWLEDFHLMPRQDGGDGTDGGDGGDGGNFVDPGNGDGGDTGDGADITPSDEASSPEETGDSTTRRLNTASTLDPDAPRPTKTGSSRGNGTDKEEFDLRSPVANIVMQTPNQFLGKPLYKAGDTITWGWNYTFLLGTPTAIDVILSCQTVSATWTLTANMSFEDVGSFTWDSSVQQTDASQPLLTEDYKVLIKDSDDDMDDPSPTASAGYLPPTGAAFAISIYTPRDYTPLADWNCATCSAAIDGLERKALGFAITMSIVTVASFTWFVSGLSL